MSSFVENCIAFKIEPKMVIELVKKALIEQNDKLLKQMFVELANFEEDDLYLYQYEIMYGIREKNEEIRKLDFEDASIEFYPYCQNGHADLWDNSHLKEDEIHYLPIPYNERLFEPKFKSWEEIESYVRQIIPWIPNDYNIKEHIVLLQATVYC